MYTLDLDSRTVAPFGVSFAHVLTPAKGDTLAQYVRGIVSPEDMAAITAEMAADIAADFERERAAYSLRANARKVAAYYGHEKVEESDVDEATEIAESATDVAEYAALILGNSDKTSSSFALNSVRNGDDVAEVRVVVTWRKYGQPTRTIDPNMTNGL